jgi:enoyl-CoA hydratase/carnithine racemase
LNAEPTQRLLEGVITDKVIAEKQGRVGWLTFNQPQKRNAISVDMWEAVPTVLDTFENDPDIRVIALKGAGDQAFVSGADISQFDQHRAERGAVNYYEEIAEGAQMRIHACDKPTIAMIRGYCLGGGVNIALCCDLRIAGASGRFGIPAARVGLGYRLSAMTNLINAVGQAKAREMFFTARQMAADAALEANLVHVVVPDAELAEIVDDYCATIAANAPLTITAGKRMMRELLKPGPGVDIAACKGWLRSCFDSEDYIEGRRAFMEKRRPVFQGR